jgi:hypothetical protein
VRADSTFFRPAVLPRSRTEQALYFRRLGDVWRWTPAEGARRFLKGVAWFNPTISPGGRYLAYAIWRKDGFHNIYLMDLSSGSKPELIGRKRALPAFLTATQLWWMSEGPGVCGPGIDEPMIYDINEMAESHSIIRRLVGIWPATSSNF